MSHESLLFSSRYVPHGAGAPKYRMPAGQRQTTTYRVPRSYSSAGSEGSDRSPQIKSPKTSTFSDLGGAGVRLRMA